MSKSTGNFLTLKEAVGKFSADGKFKLKFNLIWITNWIINTSSLFSYMYFIHKPSTCMKRGWYTIQAFMVLGDPLTVRV